MASMALCSFLCILIFIIILRAQETEEGLPTRMKRDDEIQRYFISSEPPYDNYYNISKAVYPSVDLPSLLISITVTFLDINATQSNNGTLPKRSTVNTNRGEQNGSELRPAMVKFSGTYRYTWSISCLYVRGGNISLSSMNVFSLWAIWPNRREKELHLTLPQFCEGSPSDPPHNETMIYFLSTLQDIAIGPSLLDPRLNTAECVTDGLGQAQHFSGRKKLFYGVSWSFLVISLVVSMFASQLVIVQLRTWSTEEKRRKKKEENEEEKKEEKKKENYQSKIVAVMVLSIIVCLGGISLNIYAFTLSSCHQDLYSRVFLLFVATVLIRRLVWCICVHKVHRNIIQTCKNISCKKVMSFMSLTAGHENETSKNFVSCFVVYPAIFMACHHLLWIFLGVLTEPFWGITILGAVFSISFCIYFLVYHLHVAFLDPKIDRFMCTMIFCLILGGFIAVILFLLVLLTVAQVFLSESLISTVIQNLLVFVATIWFKSLKHDTKKGKAPEMQPPQGQPGTSASGSD